MVGRKSKIFRGEVLNWPTDSLLHKTRYRCFGGTSRSWGGRCLLYDPIDFERRDYVPDSGWPFDRSELMQHYERALQLCEAGSIDFGVQKVLPNRRPEMIPGLKDGDIITTAIERWSPPTHFGERYRAEFHKARNLRVILNASCTAINIDTAMEAVQTLTVRAGPDKVFTLRASAFVLATGGIEVPRLLLASNQQISKGIGNQHGNVGRYYMTHVVGSIGTAHVTVDPKSIDNGYSRDVDNVYVRRRISISEDAQRRERLPNFTAFFHYPPVPDPSHSNAILSAMFIASHFRAIRHGIPPGMGITETGGIETGRELWLRHFRNLVLDSPNLLAFIPKFAYLRFLKRRRIPSVILPTKRPVFPLLYHVEQTPNRDSRVFLSDKRDDFGVPRVVLDFRLNQFDVGGIVRAHQLIDKSFRKAGIGRVEFIDENLEAAVRRRAIPTVAHFIGTARMAENPKKGVVDRNCRVFGTRNLFVASSAVFPTSSHANPTLTIVAMACRLSDHLKQSFQPL